MWFTGTSRVLGEVDAVDDFGRTASCFLFRMSFILLIPSWHWVLSLFEFSRPNMLI